MSPYTLQLVCLANSYREGGRCVAGKIIGEAGYSEWVRPVRPDQDRLNLQDVMIEGTRIAGLLDILQVDFVEPKPVEFQTENHVIDTERPWRQSGTVDTDTVVDAIDDLDKLWINGHSTGNGINDRVPAEEAAQFSHSLMLIRPEQFEIRVQTEGGGMYPRKKKVRAAFNFKGASYILAITDPLIHSEYKPRKEGRYPLDGSHHLVCVSLSMPFKGDNSCYKLVAGVIAI